MALSLRRAVAASLPACAVLLVACGARGPLDTTIIEVVVSDATVDAPVEAGPDGGDAAADALDAPVDSPADAVDAAPDVAMGPDGGPILDCLTCLEQTCGTQILTCLTSTTCRTALQCSGACLTGGTPNIPCIENCTMGNATTEEQLLGLFGCIAGSCPNCLSALGGVGGL
jgi:hypothetical protein